MNRVFRNRLVLFLLTFLSLISVNSFAAELYITLNEGQHLFVANEIDKVFISEPKVADYKVIDKHTLVVYANGIGQARLIIYGKDGSVLQSDRIIVDLNLDRVRKQLKFQYPDLDIKLQSIGTQISVSGTVRTNQERDDIYRSIATLLGRKKINRWEKSQQLTFKSDSGDIDEPENMIFDRNMTWEGIIEHLKVATAQQVNVKISVAQVTQSFDSTIGVDWKSVGSDVNVGQFVFSQFKASDLSSIITALGNDDVAQVLAEPNLTVLSGESASFLVGGEVPVIVTNDGNVNISFKEYGVRLNLTAKVLSANQIRMQLNPEVSEVDKYIEAEGIQVPQLSTRRAMTTVELADGDSFILGGLMNSTDYEALQKVPLLGDIPVLGAAFRKSSTERKKTELVIVATVNLVQPTKSTEIQLPHINKTSTWTRLLDWKTEKTSSRPSDAMIRLLSQGGFIE